MHKNTHKNKIRNIKEKIYIIIILIICICSIYFGFWKKIFPKINTHKLKKIYNQTVIEIDLKDINNVFGPGSLLKGYSQVLPYSWNNCYFIESPKNKYYTNSNYIYIPFAHFQAQEYNNFIESKLINKLIFGPAFVPAHWFLFPDRNIYVERDFKTFLNLTKGIVVHSERVRDFLAQKSNTTALLNKFIIVRPCTNIKPERIKSFQERKIDIIFYEKYADSNHRAQGNILLNLFKKTSYKIESMKYGGYNKKKMIDLADNSKFIIYFSFYDTGAIGLKEIQNFGVIAFTLQKDLVIDNESTFFIPELENKDNIEFAYNKIIEIIELIKKSGSNTEIIAKKNQIVNSCENSLIDLCKSL